MMQALTSSGIFKQSGMLEVTRVEYLMAKQCNAI